MKKSTKKGWKIVGIVFCVVILLLAIACGWYLEAFLPTSPVGRMQRAKCCKLRMCTF